MVSKGAGLAISVYHNSLRENQVAIIHGIDYLEVVVGLEDKRFKQLFTTDVLPEISKQISGIVGGDVEIDIDWESFSSKESMQEIEHQVFGRVLEALTAVAGDDIGKEALRESMKSVSVINLPSKDTRECTFDKGCLKLQTDWTDFWSIFSAEDIQEIMEQGL